MNAKRRGHYGNLTYKMKTNLQNALVTTKLFELGHELICEKGEVFALHCDT